MSYDYTTWRNAFKDRAEAAQQLQRYPDPFFSDFSDLRLPQSVGDSLNWGHYFFLVDPIARSALSNRAQYVVTNITYGSDDPALNDRYREYLEDVLSAKPFLVDASLNKNVYGNGFISVLFPSKKLLTCPSCKFAKTIDAWDYRVSPTLSFEITCPSCGFSGDAQVEEVPLRDSSRVRLISWDPRDMDVRSAGLGTFDYYMSIPKALRARVAAGAPWRSCRRTSSAAWLRRRS